MAQKMIDIRPVPLQKKERRAYKEKKYAKNIIFIFLFFVLIISSGLYFRSYRVDVAIWPVTESFTFSETVIVNALQEKEISVMSFQETINGGRDFQVLGRSIIEKKTKGTISVCQDYSDISQPIRAETRFVCENGKLFFAEEAFTIPGRSQSEGKTIPGCVGVLVVAAEAGEEYNISSSSKFSLPGLQGTALYGRFFGQSFALTEEGKREEVAYLKNDEISKAEKILYDELFEKGKKSLEEQFSGEFMMENRGQYSSKIIERSTPREGEKETFRIEMKIDVDVIAIEKDSVDNFLKDNLPDGFVWHEESKEIGYDFPRANFEEKSGEIDIDFRAQIYKEVDVMGLKRSIAGIWFDEADEYFQGRDDIKKSSLSFYPLGPSFVPRSLSRINVELLFDKN